MTPHDAPTPREHWETVYAGNPSTSVSWYRDHLDVSLQLLAAAGLDRDSRLIDVGGGASTLVDDVLAGGVRKVSVLDLSSSALAVARERMGALSHHVEWIVGDITQIALAPAAYTHWHDRAVLHFLTSPDDIHAYVDQVRRAVASGGHVVIGNFAPDGPERCSGLPVVRRSAKDIAAAFGPEFTLLEARSERHRTPGGREQAFAYGLLRRL